MMQVIKNLLRWARITRGGDGSGDLPVQQVSYLGKIANAVTWFPYGVHANIPPDALAVLLAMQGRGEARVALPGSPTARPTVAEGELVVYHPATGSEIHFKANGDIEVTSDTAVTVTAPITTVAGDLTVTGDLTMQGTMAHEGSTIGFFGATPVAKQTITGNRAGGTAQTDFYSDVDLYGFVTDSST